MRVASNDSDDRAGLRGYVQFNKYTYVHTYIHGDLPRQHSFGTTLRFTGPVPADSRQLTPSVSNCCMTR